MIDGLLARFALPLAIVAALGFAAAAGWQTVRLVSEQRDRAREQRDYSVERAQAAAKALIASEGYRLEERRMERIAREAEHAGKLESDRSARIAAGLRAERDGLRNDIAEFAAGRRAAEDTLAACRRDAAELGALLADALRREEDATRAAETHAGSTRTLLEAWPVTP